MTLQFVIRVNRKSPPRIGVLRTNYENGKIQGYTNLGTLLGLEPDALNEFITQNELTLPEQYQLENYAAYLHFNKEEFNDSPEELQRSLIYSSPKYDEALVKLWSLAKKHNIAFNPAEIQQRALLHKAKAVERKLNELTQKSVNILEGLDIDIRRFDTDEVKARWDKTTQKLFELILTLDKPLFILCQEFMSIAKNDYAKNAHLKPHYFKEYAATAKRLPLWYNTVAIDLLISNGLNPIDHISVTKIAEHWIRLRKESLSLNKAFEQFKATFLVKTTEIASVKKTLEEQYQKGFSTSNI